MSYNPYCLCSECRAETFIQFGLGTYSPQEYVMRARCYKLNEAQQERIDEMKLKLWNSSVKGEKAS